MRYCLEIGKNDTWIKILDYCVPKAKFIAFNILYSGTELNNILVLFEQEKNFKFKEKGYTSGKYLVFRKDDNLLSFLYKIDFTKWTCVLEDASFVDDSENEFVYTITHEKYLIVDEETKEDLKLKNIFFEFFVD